MTDTWQQRHAQMLDQEVAELEKVIVELDNGEAIIATRQQPELCTAIRSLQGWIRSEMSTMTGEARTLRTEHSGGPVLPMHVTRRIG